MLILDLFVGPGSFLCICSQETMFLFAGISIFQSLNDMEAKEVSTFLGILLHIHLSHNSDTRLWVLEGSGLFSCGSFLLHLTRAPSPLVFPLSSFIWKSRVPFKVWVFVWSLVLNKLSTNDVRQARRPYKRISLDRFVMGKRAMESHDHLFLLCDEAQYLWNNLFGVLGEACVCPGSMNWFLQILFKGSGRDKDASLLWECGVFTILWFTWLERNARIFNDQSMARHMLWDRVVYMASLWASARGAYQGVPISVLQWDCRALIFLSI